jgi:hypothetical protein
MPPKTAEQWKSKALGLRKKLVDKKASLSAERLRQMKKKIRRAQRRRRNLVALAAKKAKPAKPAEA